MSDQIQIVEQLSEHFPTKFEWQGQIFEVEAIEKCCIEMHSNAERPSYHLKVRCNSGVYQLTQDINLGQWTIHQDA